MFKTIYKDIIFKLITITQRINVKIFFHVFFLRLNIRLNISCKKCLTLVTVLRNRTPR